MKVPAVLDKGTLSFSIESRILRELGERLVKEPEVAVLELVKNAYDADANRCIVDYRPSRSITISDDGSGMTLDQFILGWMRIGTSAKEAASHSPKYNRRITGEKGIGRFAVRFLGRTLHLESVALDRQRSIQTKLVADFDWVRFDEHEDLNQIKVPYRLEETDADTPVGTTLTITGLRPQVQRIDLRKVRSGSVGVLTPLRPLFLQLEDDATASKGREADPGFSLEVRPTDDTSDADVASGILDRFVLRARLKLEANQLQVQIYRRGRRNPYLNVTDTFRSNLGRVNADIRFFPRRKGTFTDMPVNGREAQRWIMANGGVAVFDRDFRVQPYGTPRDDWLTLAADAARNVRDPRSSVAQKHFPMQPGVRASPSENWMLRLPEPAQLVGVVQVEGRRGNKGEGLVAAADREGFVANEAFLALVDLVRGAVELIAVADRGVQQEEEAEQRVNLLARVQEETRSAIVQVQDNPNISAGDKTRLVAALARTQTLVEEQDQTTRVREQQLEVMSLLGVVAGFMTHEFGVALKQLETTQAELARLAKTDKRFLEAANSFSDRIRTLRDFVTYSQGYVQGVRRPPEQSYPARPRLQQVKRVFGKYAEERGIKVQIDVDSSLVAPSVPAPLYNGVALNLYSNALKAVTASTTDAGVIAFRAWNEGRNHYLEVSDNGIGVPTALRDRVFDAFYTTTGSRADPLGSGMGLGLTLVKRAVEAFGGKVDLVAPAVGFSTTVRVRLPLAA